MIVLIVYFFMWLIIFGGVGIRMECLVFYVNVICDFIFGGVKFIEGFYKLYCLFCCLKDDMWFDVVE